MMEIMGLLGMYFDALVVFVTNSSLLFRLANAILLLLFSTVSVLTFIIICTGIIKQTHSKIHVLE